MTGARVLVVEDEILIRLILTETLADAGFAVTEAAGGEEAVRLLDQHGPYDLLITDVQMPGGIDGVAVARHARERSPGMPIVFATGRADSVRAFGRLGDGEALVAKPYGPEQMLDAIRRVRGLGPDDRTAAELGSRQQQAREG